MRIIPAVTTVLAAAGLAAGAAVIAVPAQAESPAPAATSTPATSTPATTIPVDGVLHDRLATYCGRVPERLSRAGKLGPRLAAGEDTAGSTAWLKARTEAARQKGRGRVADRLGERLERRADLAAALPDRIAELERAKTECAAAGLTGSAN